MHRAPLQFHNDYNYLQVAEATTNQAVGSSNLSGRANLRLTGRMVREARRPPGSHLLAVRPGNCESGNRTADLIQKYIAESCTSL